MDGVFDVLGGLVSVVSNVASGGLIGIASRFITEILKGRQAKRDADHEYRMRELDWKMAQSQGEQKIRELDRAAEGALDIKRLDALIEATRATAKRTGIKFVDGWNAVMRPAITSTFMLMYGSAKIALFYVIVVSGDGFKAVNLAQAVLTVWTAEDQAIFGAILGFWFIGRDFISKK